MLRGRERPARPRAARRPSCSGAAGPVDLQVGPGRRPLLRRPERRHDPPHPRAGTEPHADRRRDRHAHRRRGSAGRELRRQRLVRPRRRHAGLRVGPRRRRGLRRLDLRHARPHATPPPGSTPCACGSPIRAASRTPTPSPSPRAPRRRRPSPRPRPAPPGGSATRWRSRARPPISRARPCPPRRLTLGAQPPALQPHGRQLPHARAPDLPRRGVGSFVAPDHEYPSYLELRMTATDARGLMTTVTRRIDPRTVRLTLESSPAGLQADPRLRDGGHAVHARRDPRLLQLPVGVVDPSRSAATSTLRVLERRRRPRAQRGGAGHGHHLPRDLHAGATAARIAGTDVVGTNVSEALPGRRRGLPHHRERRRARHRAAPPPGRELHRLRAGARPLRATPAGSPPRCSASGRHQRARRRRSGTRCRSQRTAARGRTGVLDQPAQPGRRHGHPALAGSRRGHGRGRADEREQLAHHAPGHLGYAAAPGPTARCRAT